MRILQIHTRYRQRGGEGHVVDAEARMLREDGHEVHQLVAKNPRTATRAAASLALSVWNPQWKRRVEHAAEDFQPDVAHVHNTWFGMSPSVIHGLKKKGVPVVMTLHNYRLTCANGLLFRDGAPCELCVGTHPWHAVRYGCYRDSRALSIPAAVSIDVHRRVGTWAEAVSAFVTFTQFQRELMIRAGLPESKIAVRPNFVADPGPRLGPPSASKTVLYVGRLSPEKGIDWLLDVMPMTHELDLVVAGGGPLEDQVRTKQSSNVRFLGAVSPETVRRLMLTSRALIFPSRWYEGLPLSILEAFAAGLPVMGTDLGATGQVIRRELGDDWVFDSASESCLVSILDHLLDDSWCDHASVKARRSYETSFSRATAKDSLLDLYHMLKAGEDPETPKDSLVSDQ